MKDYLLNHVALLFLILLAMIAIFSDLLLSNLGWHIDIDLDHINKLPDFRCHAIHCLGTDYLGRDVLSMIIHATRNSLIISLFSGLIAIGTGILIGGIGGFLGDESIYISRAQLTCYTIISILLLFYIPLLSSLHSGWTFGLSLTLLLIITVIVFYLLKSSLIKLKWFRQNIKLPIDLMNLKFIEIVYAIPLYFILLALAAFIRPSVFGLVLIIGFTYWPHTALLVRTEVLRIRSREFIKVLKLSGIPSWRIFLFHVIPNSYRPALINMSFVMASLLIVESTLSFIGVGLPSELITWGKILAGFKVNTSNWWTVAFPGIIIFCTILSLHRLRRWMAQVIEH